MRLLFPHLSREALPAEPKKLFDKIKRLDTPHGFVCAELPTFDVILLTYDRQSIGCVAVYGPRFQSIPVPEFFAALPRAERVSFFATDERLLRCLAVLFQKEPTERLPVESLSPYRVIERLAADGRDKVLMVGRDDLRTLVYCRAGEPYALYPAPGEVILDAPTVAERVIRFLFDDPADPLQVDLYEDLQVDLSTEDVEEHMEGAASPASKPKPAPRDAVAPAPSLVVKLGDRVMGHYPVDGEMTIGRDPDNHITLDNVSVSRVHAKVIRDGGRLLIEDLSSANGVLKDGQRVASTELGVGESVTIGKFTLLYPHYEPSQKAIPSPAMPKGGPRSVVETFAFVQRRAVPQIEHRGKSHKMGGLIFLIGKGEEANVKIGGLFVAPVHVRIIRDPRGQYLLQHIGGLAAVKINGARVKKEAELHGGEVIQVGRERFNFQVPAEGPDQLAPPSTIAELA